MWQGGCVFDADNIEECEKKIYQMMLSANQF